MEDERPARPHGAAIEACNRPSAGRARHNRPGIRHSGSGCAIGIAVAKILPRPLAARSVDPYVGHSEHIKNFVVRHSQRPLCPPIPPLRSPPPPPPPIPPTP